MRNYILVLFSCIHTLMVFSPKLKCSELTQNIPDTFSMDMYLFYNVLDTFFKKKKMFLFLVFYNFHTEKNCFPQFENYQITMSKKNFQKNLWKEEQGNLIQLRDGNLRIMTRRQILNTIHYHFFFFFKSKKFKISEFFSTHIF